MLHFQRTVFFQDQGGREYMEDRLDIQEPLVGEYDYYAVFDGHGGADIADFVKHTIRNVLSDLINNKTALVLNEEDILFQAMKIVSDKLPIAISRKQGTTAVLVLKKGPELWVANCGDSRAIIALNNGSSITLTDDHKPNREDEHRRIVLTGGFVAPSFKGDVYRVNGSLAVSRSLGDLDLYPHVTWKPEITYAKIGKPFNYLIVATDGIWDVIKNNEISVVLQHHHGNKTASNIAKDICALARARGSMDNVSLILVRLNSH